MNSIEWETPENPIISTEEYKKKLIMLVKERPNIWILKNFDFDMQKEKLAWKEIRKEMGYVCTLKEQKATWDSLNKMYFRKIFIRTIERNFEAPKWVFFHDMSFLYDITKENIQKKLGGISPPLFKPNPKKPQTFRCPCCIYMGPDQESEPIMSSVEVKQEDELGTVSMATSETSFLNCDEIIENSNLNTTERLEPTLEKCTEALQNLNSFSSAETDTADDSLCSLEAQNNENQNCFWSNCTTIQQNEAENSLVPSPSHDLSKDISKTCEVIDLIDDNEACNGFPLAKPPQPQPPKDNFENMTDNPTLGVNLSVPLLQMSTILIKNCAGTMEPESSRNDNSFTGPVVRSLDLTQSPGPSETGSVNSKNSNEISNEQNIPINKMTHNQIRAMERLKIIEAVKANPPTYLGYDKKRRFLHNQAWQTVAKILGTQVHTVKNRWKLIKTRYLKELVLERYSKGKVKSTWECFEAMEFLRSSMQKEINEIHDTRIQMQDTISKKRANELSSSSSFEKEAPKYNYIIEGTIDKPKFQISDKNIVAYVNTDQNIKISSVETVKLTNPVMRTYGKKPKQTNQPVVLDGSVMPILQNRPVKVTAVQIPQSLDLTNDDNDMDQLINKTEGSQTPRNEINVPPSESPKILPSLLDLYLSGKPDTSNSSKDEEAQPPAKKLRKISIALNNETNKLFSATPPAATEPAKKGQPLRRLGLHKPQKVYPPLDLTLEDDLPEDPITFKKVPTANFQEAFVNGFLNTNHVFPTLDLTKEEEKDEEEDNDQDEEKDQEEDKDQDEDKDHDKLETKNEISNAKASTQISEKNYKNVICLDDDDSVGSYEELIVYYAQENKS